MITISWSIRDNGTLLSRGGKDGASWNDVEERLADMRDYSGSLTITLVRENLPRRVVWDKDDKPITLLGEITKRLTVSGNDGLFYILLGDYEREEHEYRSYDNHTNPSLYGKTFEIGGQLYHGEEICGDFDDVVKVCREFLETGDVSPELLS